MIYIYISISIIILFLFSYLIIKKTIKLQITWNEHKSHVIDIVKKTTRLLSVNDEIIYKQNKLINQIKYIDKKVEKKSHNIENKLNAIQYELLLDYAGKIAKEKKDKKQISSKAFEEIKALLHNNKMDNRIRELLKKK